MRSTALAAAAGSMVALVLFLSGCQSVPPKEIPVSPDSSILAVDVDFTAHIKGFTRTLSIATNSLPFLSGVVFLKESLDGRLAEAPELISASWIKGSRGYLLNPEPGTYLVVAVSFAIDVSTPGVSGSLGGGFSGSVSSGGAIGHTVILPAAMVQQTRTTIGPSRVEFAGALQIRSGDRINASTEFEDELDRRMAELVRPGVTSKSGLAGHFTRTWMANPTESSISNEASDRESFFGAALADFGNSPWAEVVRPLD